jgi:large-conductance mechanosensitive channel
MDHVHESFKMFIVEHGILTTMASVTIAFSTGSFIRSLVSDIILPLMLRNKANVLNYNNFLRELLTWVLVFILTFVIINYVFKRYVHNHEKHY